MSKRTGEKDFRDLRRKGDKRQRESLPSGTTRRWWDKKGSDCAESISSSVAFLQKNQSARMRQMVISARLYGNIAMGGAGSAAYARLMQQQSAVRDRITYNAIQSIVDTLVSHIGETKPRPFYLTSGGDYKQQRKAKKLSQFSDGVFYETKTYRLAPECFRDAVIWGDGFMHVYAHGGKLCHERVLPSELWVDEVEAQYGFPRTMSRVKVVDRDELIAAFPSHKKELLEVSKAVDTTAAVDANISDMVTVAESWHLAAPDEDGEMQGGWHGIACGDVMLLEPEEWPHDFFPFARISWCKRPVGYWSQGLAEQLQGEQMELNKELMFIQRSMHLASGFKIFLQNGSKVSKEHFNNDVGTIINYAGSNKPSYEVPQPIHPSYFENVDRIIERMYRKAGVSELSAGNVKPAGLDSKPSLREYKDTQNERHKTAGEAFDEFILTVAMLDRVLAKGLKGYTVRVPGKTSFHQIDFDKDIGKFKDEEFVLQCFPVSQLPRDPAGRTQTVQEWVQAGWLTPRQGRRLMDFPDLDAVESMANAQEDIIQKNLDLIVDEGEFNPPEPTDDLSLCKEMCLQYIQLYRTLGLEPEKMDLLRTFNSQTDMLIQRSMPPPSPMGMAPGTDAGVPQAKPMQAPQSQLLPQAA